MGSDGGVADPSAPQAGASPCSGIGRVQRLCPAGSRKARRWTCAPAQVGSPGTFEGGESSGCQPGL